MRFNMRFNESTAPTASFLPSTQTNGRHHQRKPTHPFPLTSRQKPRRWPLVFRFIKGAVHGAIIVPVFYHALFTALIAYLNDNVFETVGLPSSIIPSLSIVVGLMLVFRNQTSYNRFWDGRNSLQTVNTSVRNLIRTILTHAHNNNHPLGHEEKHDIERTVRILMAIPYAVKNHLRGEWGAAWAPGIPRSDVTDDGRSVYNQVYANLLPTGLEGHEQDGLCLPFQLTFFVDSFIRRGIERGWYHAPGASGMQAQLNTLMDAFGKMETIWITPIPVAHLIHQKQVLALFGCVLPFAMVDELGWWAVPIVTVVIFTLYGIEGIGSQLEDPFGYDRNDIKMDAICHDLNMELDTILIEWKKVTVAAEIAAKADLSAHSDKEAPTKQATNVKKFNPGEMFLRIKPLPAPIAVNQINGSEELSPAGVPIQPV